MKSVIAMERPRRKQETSEQAKIGACIVNRQARELESSSLDLPTQVYRQLSWTTLLVSCSSVSCLSVSGSRIVRACASCVITAGQFMVQTIEEERIGGKARPGGEAPLGSGAVHYRTSAWPWPRCKAEARNCT